MPPGKMKGRGRKPMLSTSATGKRSGTVMITSAKSKKVGSTKSTKITKSDEGKPKKVGSKKENLTNGMKTDGVETPRPVTCKIKTCSGRSSGERQTSQTLNTTPIPHVAKSKGAGSLGSGNYTSKDKYKSDRVAPSPSVSTGATPSRPKGKKYTGRSSGLGPAKISKSKIQVSKKGKLTGPMKATSNNEVQPEGGEPSIPMGNAIPIPKKGPPSTYRFFVQEVVSALKERYPNGSLDLQVISRLCAQRWPGLDPIIKQNMTHEMMARKRSKSTGPTAFSSRRKVAVAPSTSPVKKSNSRKKSSDPQKQSELTNNKRETPKVSKEGKPEPPKKLRGRPRKKKNATKPKQ